MRDSNPSPCSRVAQGAGQVTQLFGFALTSLALAFIPLTPASGHGQGAKKSKDQEVSSAKVFGTEGEQVLLAISSGSSSGAEALAKLDAALAASTDSLLKELEGASTADGDKPESPKKNGRGARAAKQQEVSAKIKVALGDLEQRATAWQLGRLLSAVVPSEQVSVSSEFLGHPAFARALALVVELGADDPAKVVRVSRALMAQRPQLVDHLPELAAAVAVVLDVPMVLPVNENLAHGCDPIVVLDHFATNERRMFFGLRGIAPELLIHLVDVATSPADLAWAVQQFAGHPAVGELYDRIDYDFDYLEKGREKRVTKAGWNLRNILEYGGICADQAYFAVTVGKAIGVPCVYTTATDGVLSHAWVGFVASSRTRPQWAEIGRFGTYQAVEGMIRDPQTMRQVSNTQMPMLVQYGIEPASDRGYAAALRISARRLLGASGSKVPVTAETVKQVLELTRLAVRACATDPRSWALVAAAADTGAMTTEQKQQWASDIIDLCGDNYPEFALRTISPMIETITDPVERHAALDGAYEIFQSRGDLAGQLLIAQGALFELEGDLAAAGRCYETILNRYANDGPFAITALAKASAILGAANNASANVTLHDRAFRAMEVPEGISPQFAKQSNWYRSGVMLAQALRIAGRERDAALLEQRMTAEMR